MPKPSKKKEPCRLCKDWPLYVLFAPASIYFILFKYVPMAGLLIAFKKYNFTDGIWGSPWVGWDNFELLFQNPQMLDIILNTFILSMLSLFVGFPFPIILAILLNEVRKSWFKRTVQTFVYLPHFMNWVIIGGMVVLIFAQENGLINQLLDQLFGVKYSFLYKESSWMSIFIGSGIWKHAGWGSIIYLAALTNIDQSLYEAASLDGAGKCKQIWHVTLPGIAPVVILMLVLSMGHVMEVGFDHIYNLQNASVKNISEVISTWSYRVGLKGAQYGLTTALGLFESLVGLILVLLTNQFARRFDRGLF